MRDTVVNDERTKVKAITFFAVFEALLVSVFFFEPIKLYLVNQSELNFQLNDLIVASLLQLMIITIIGCLLLVFLNKKVFPIILAVIMGIAIGVYVQANYVRTQYGLLDGVMPDWTQYRAVAIWNTIMWVSMLLLPIIIIKIIPRWDKLFLIIAAVIIISQFVGIIPLMTELDNSEKGGRYVLTTENLLDLSKNENIIVIILDAFDASYFDDFISKHPEFKTNLFSDFTYYPNTTAVVARTNVAIPYIITGHAYTGEKTYTEFCKEAYENAPLLDVLESMNYETSIYTHDGPEGEQIKCINNMMRLDGEHIKSYFALIKKMDRLCAMIQSPHIMKKHIWDPTLTFEDIMVQDDFEFEKYSYAQDTTYYSLDKELVAKYDAPVFKLYHLRGTHPPYTYTEDFEDAQKETTLETVEIANMKFLTWYFSQMKALGIYDSAEIIVMADHGDVSKDQNPILLIKKENEKRTELLIDNRAVTYSNLYSTMLKMVNPNIKCAEKTIDEITDKDNILRHYYYYNQKNVNEYAIEGFAGDTNSIRFVKKHNIIPGKSKEYELGEILYFGYGKDMTAQAYVSGLERAERYDAWTNSRGATFEFPLKGKIEKDLILKLKTLHIAGGCQRVEVFINGNYANTYIATERDLCIPIPKEEVVDCSLKLKMEFPDACKISNVDNRVLSLGLESMELAYSDGTKETKSISALEEGKIEFSIKGTSNKFILTGWHSEEEGHRWSKDKAKMAFVCDVSKDCVMDVMYCSYPNMGETAVLLNGKEICILPFRKDMGLRRILLPKEQFNENYQTLEFVTPLATEALEEGTEDLPHGIAVQFIDVSFI